MLYTCVKLSKLKQHWMWAERLDVARHWREAGRVGRSRPAFAVGVLLCVGSLRSSSVPGTPCPSLGLSLRTRNNLPVPSSLRLTLPALAGSHENLIPTCSFPASKALPGEGYRVQAAFCGCCWEGKLDFLYRVLLTSSKQQIVASGAQRLFLFKSNTCFYYPSVLEEGTTTKITPKQSRFGSSSN